MSIRRKLSLSLLLFLSIALLVVGSVVYFQQRQSLIQHTFDDLESVATLQELRLSALNEQNLERLSLIRSRTQLRISLAQFNVEQAPDAQQRMNRILRDALNSLPVLKRLDVADPNGVVVASTDPQRLGHIIAAEPAFKHGRNEPRADYLNLSDSGQLQQHMSGPLTLDGRVQGVLLVEFDSRDLLKVVGETAGMGKSGETLLVRHDGRLQQLITPPRQVTMAPLTSLPKTDPLLHQALHGHRQFLTGVPDYRGELVLAVTHSIDELNWGLVVKIDNSEALAPLAELRYSLITTLLLLIAVGGLLSELLLRQITAPISWLTNTVSLIQQGDHSQRIGYQGKDELGLLARVFNQMMDNLQDSHRAQQRLNQELEQRVEQRTAALAESNRAQQVARDEAERARAEAEEANAVKSRFLANMSHEIRTPMNGVLGMTNLLLRTPLTEQQRDLSASIKDSGEHLMTVIDDILDFSKLEANRVEIQLSSVELNGYLEQIVTLFGGRALEKKLELNYRIAPEVPAFILCDAVRLKQVLTNLVSNAIKFTSAGEVLLQVSHQGVEQGTHRLRFSVRDSGIGISKAEQAKLFDAFYQSQSSSTRQFGGTGLGLSISARLVELMGGRISVESEPGQGAVFSFELPVRVAEGTPKRHLKPNLVELRGKRLLVVDDNPTNRDILHQVTRAWGLKVVTFSQGHEALASIKQGDRYDVAVLDAEMPEGGGIQLARQIRQAGQPELPLVMFCSENAIDARAIPARIELLRKPMRNSALYNALVNVLREGEPSLSLDLAVEVEPAPDSLIAEHNPLKILVAEDNRINHKLLTQLLADLGYSAQVVESGSAVLDICREQSFDVILMDAQMPGMDGYEATRHLRKLDTERPYIIAVTASVMEGDREYCLSQGMNAYLSKPISEGELREALLTAYRTLDSVPACESGEPAPVVNEQALIDQNRLQALPVALWQELFSLYMDEASAILAKLSRALDDGDLAAVGNHAHSLKGGAINIGLNGCAELFAGIEQSANAGEASRVGELVENCEETLEATRREGESLLQEDTLITQ
ncbi:hybrid sensor histidine kinase/response regulator [Marinobacterium arenosum]|uniref:hybrid sensor histidine kinase/response regulator n=1 Tax=Marinobacterium arenosum TaxID=2862496 RepID=UPI001C937353|nr:hybrid sensor histidine kinase/response regulator [Marinobacterium arenosum]MBY4675077.1 response regulator [Marinobacterium arenosum]